MLLGSIGVIRKFRVFNLFPNNKVLVVFFLVGVISHLAFWTWQINYDSTPSDFMCGEASCFMLVVADFPVSLIYVSGNQANVTTWSSILGSLYWGGLLMLLGKLVLKQKSNAYKK